MNRLCICTGGGTGLALLASLGLVSAMSLSSATFGQCAQPAANCQLPDQLGHGAGGTVGATSDANPNALFEVTDNFYSETGGAVSSICWWGFYVDFNQQVGCGPGPGDDFTVRYYSNVEGFPGQPDTLLAEYTGADLVVTKVATGNVIPTAIGDLIEYEYTGTHPVVTVDPATCIWIAIQNATTGDCFWLWSSSPSQSEDPPGLGDNVSYQRDVVDPPGPWGDPSDYDLAFCTNLTLGDPNSCDTPIYPACESATGSCSQINSTPGCDDPECCTLVCTSPGLAFCCSGLWSQPCVDAASDLCILLPEPCPPLTEANCQLPDLLGAGGRTNDIFLGFASDDAADARIADDFLASATGDVTHVCWWGFYIDANGIDCSGNPPPSTFTISYYADAGNGIPQEPAFASFPVVAAAEQDGIHPQSDTTPDDDIIVWKFDATHAPVPVVENTCYFIQIQATGGDGSCVWFWETAPFNPTGDIAFNYSLADDGTGYDYTDATDVEFGWCIDVALGLNNVCTPETVQNQQCDPGGAIILTQNSDPTVLADGTSVACSVQAGAGYTTDNSYARSYDLGAIAETAGQDIEVVCIRVGIEIQDGSAYPVAMNIYEDTDGGAPTAPGTDLNLLGTTTLVMPWNVDLDFLQATFDPPVEVPADTIMVVEMQCPSRAPAVGGDGGGMWPGCNTPSSPSSYLLSEGCSVPTYVSATDLGFPNAQIVHEVHVNVATTCPWDCQSVPNGQVDVADFLAILAQFGQVGTSCDFDGGGVSVTDFLAFLANFGPCP